MRAPSPGCRLITSYSVSLSGPGLWRIAFGVSIFPTSWIAAAVRMRATSARGGPFASRSSRSAGRRDGNGREDRGRASPSARRAARGLRLLLRLCPRARALSPLIAADHVKRRRQPTLPPPAMPVTPDHQLAEQQIFRARAASPRGCDRQRRTQRESHPEDHGHEGRGDAPRGARPPDPCDRTPRNQQRRDRDRREVAHRGGEAWRLPDEGNGRSRHARLRDALVGLGGRWWRCRARKLRSTAALERSRVRPISDLWTPSCRSSTEPDLFEVGNRAVSSEIPGFASRLTDGFALSDSWSAVFVVRRRPRA